MQIWVVILIAIAVVIFGFAGGFIFCKKTRNRIQTIGTIHLIPNEDSTRLPYLYLEIDEEKLREIHSSKTALVDIKVSSQK